MKRRKKTETYYKIWINHIAKRTSQKNIKEHILHHAKQLSDPNVNAPLSWIASMYNLIKIYESVYGVRSTVPIQLYKLIKKYNKDKMKYTPPPFGKIPKGVIWKRVRADTLLRR